MSLILQCESSPSELRYTQYEHHLEPHYLPSIRSLISKDLSEPYSIYVYRYFLCQWAHLCFMVRPSYCSQPQSKSLPKPGSCSSLGSRLLTGNFKGSSSD